MFICVPNIRVINLIQSSLVCLHIHYHYCYIISYEIYGYVYMLYNLCIYHYVIMYNVYVYYLMSILKQFSTLHAVGIWCASLNDCSRRIFHIWIHNNIISYYTILLLLQMGVRMDWCDWVYRRRVRMVIMAHWCRVASTDNC